MCAASILPGVTSNIATSSTSGSAGKTTPKPSATELSSFHSAAAGPLTISAASTKAIKRIFGLLLSEDGPGRPLRAQASSGMHRRVSDALAKGLHGNQTIMRPAASKQRVLTLLQGAAARP